MGFNTDKMKEVEEMCKSLCYETFGGGVKGDKKCHVLYMPEFDPKKLTDKEIDEFINKLDVFHQRVIIFLKNLKSTNKHK